jgi:hypothetical protein
MADLTITAANVKLKSAGPVRTVLSAASITQGQPLRPDGDAWRPAGNTSAAAADARVIALTPCTASGQWVAVAGAAAEIDLGATLVVGETYVVSDTAGAIAPIGDLGAGDFPTILGVAIAADTLRFRPQAAGVAKP